MTVANVSRGAHHGGHLYLLARDAAYPRHSHSRIYNKSYRASVGEDSRFLIMRARVIRARHLCLRQCRPQEPPYARSRCPPMTPYLMYRRSIFLDEMGHESWARFIL